MNPAQFPSLQIPPAKSSRALVDGTVGYYYPLPEQLGVQKNVAPNIAIGPQLAVLSLLPKQTKDCVDPQAACYFYRAVGRSGASLGGGGLYQFFQDHRDDGPLGE